MRVVHLMASPFFGGPERQMLGLARALPADIESIFVTFPERGMCQALLAEVRGAGFKGTALTHNFPHVLKATREVEGLLRSLRADVVTCSGYKPDLIGWRAARNAGIPAIVVSHGWTAATWKVRVYEWLDRFAHRGADAVVCVSQAQADKVRAAGTPEEHILVVPNAVGPEAFAPAEPAYADKLQRFFTHPSARIVGAVGRLSPEKGFDLLVETAVQVPQANFVLFGDGPLKAALQQQIDRRGLAERFVLAGFHADVGKYLPHFDVLTMSSHREGLPTVLLEGYAAGIPAVATAVGGIPEVIDDGRNGWLVPNRDSGLFAQKINQLLGDESRRRAWGEAGRAKVREQFTFARQSDAYQELFAKLVRRPLCPAS